METTAVMVLIIGLLLGLAVGAGSAWLVLRSRAQATTADQESQQARIREDLAATQAQAAEARAQAADARAEAAHARSESAKQETAVAQARAAASDAQAEAAEVSARLAAAIAKGDAARSQLQQLTADRVTLVDQFKLLSTEALERQGKTVDATTAQRLEQTKAALEPLTTLMTQFSSRLFRYAGALYWAFVTHVLTLATPIGRKVAMGFTSRGAPLIRISMEQVQAAGVTTLTRLTDTRDGAPMFGDQSVGTPTAIIWATGFAPDLDWLPDLPVTPDGWPITRRGLVDAVPGLAFVGLPFQYSLTSGLIGGVGRDAAFVADALTRPQPVRASTPAPHGSR